MDLQAALQEHKYYLSKYIWTEPAQAMAERHRAALLDAGFSEARWPGEGKNLSAKNPLRFFRRDSELTAFFVNLEPAGDGLRVFCGFASIAFIRIKNNESALWDMGISEDRAALRFLVPIPTERSEAAAAEQIAAVFRSYQGTEKDALLSLSKELRKAWLDRITQRLKPLGFRKKGNEWRKVLPSGHTLYFAADKGSYSDGYNFDVRLQAPPAPPRPGDWCAFAIREQDRERAIDPFCHHRFDWQLEPPEELDRILDWFLTDFYQPLTAGPIEPLLPKLYCARKDCPAADCPLRFTK